MSNQSIALLGASSIVGSSVLQQLTSIDNNVVAFSRTPELHAGQSSDPNVHWRKLPDIEGSGNKAIGSWISLIPIWELVTLLPVMKTLGIRKLVAMSSTSKFTKANSDSDKDSEIAEKLESAEQAIGVWCEKNNVEWVILRPTMIYGLGKDINVSTIVRFIKRFGFFPLLGAASGLRQPVHIEDVAYACVAAIELDSFPVRSYNISGAEVLSYYEMVTRIFKFLNKKPRIVKLPLFLFKAAIAVAHVTPVLRKRFAHWTPAMAQRMNQDMAFEHSEATQDFGFNPQKFVLGPKDLN